MRFILGADNTEVLIDEDDYRRVASLKMWIDYRYNGKMPYVRIRHQRRKYYLHRFILDALPGQEVDHINHSGLDNRRENLRIVSRSDNMLNGSNTERGASQEKDGKWVAYIWKDYAKYALGRFETQAEALDARHIAYEQLQQGIMPTRRDQQSANKARAASARGVSFDIKAKKWRAYVRDANGMRVSLGYHLTEQAALNAVQHARSRP